MGKAVNSDKDASQLYANMKQDLLNKQVTITCLLQVDLTANSNLYDYINNSVIYDLI